MKGQKTTITREFEAAIKKLDKGIYVLCLYVAGNSPHSLKAIRNLKQICERYLKGRYKMEVINIHQQQCNGRELVAAPTLVKRLPLPVKRLIGDLSDTAKVLVALNINIKEVQAAS